MTMIFDTQNLIKLMMRYYTLLLKNTLGHCQQFQLE